MNSDSGVSRAFIPECITLMSKISSSLAGQFRAAGVFQRERTASRTRRMSSHTGREIRLPAGHYAVSDLRDQAAALDFYFSDVWIMKEWFLGQGVERRRKCRYLIFLAFEAARVSKGQPGRNLKHLDRYVEQALGIPARMRVFSVDKGRRLSLVCYPVFQMRSRVPITEFDLEYCLDASKPRPTPSCRASQFAVLPRAYALAESA